MLDGYAPADEAVVLHVLSTEETGKYVIKLSAGDGLVDFPYMNAEITGYDYLTFV